MSSDNYLMRIFLLSLLLTTPAFVSCSGGDDDDDAIGPPTMQDDDDDDDSNPDDATDPVVITGVCEELFGDFAGVPKCDATLEDVTLNGDINADTTVESCTVKLDGRVVVNDGATLTLRAGATIYGLAVADTSLLIISQGAKIDAQGRPDAPIVFTSAAPDGDRARGDWGGLVINGKAPINIPGGTADGEGDSGPYGGNIAADNSGVLRFVRVEFGGKLYSDTNELNGIALQGVGSGTTIDFLQIHMGKDDGLEMFGGKVDLKHVLITGAADDSFDWTHGWTGRAQFIIAHQADDEGNRGIEADNWEDDFNALPRSNPTIYNATIIGGAALEEDGIRLRRGTAVTLQNAIIMNWPEGIDVSEQETIDQFTSSVSVLDNLVFFGNTANLDADTTANADIITMSTEDPALHDITFSTMADYKPSLDIAGATPPDDGFFDASANFVGAVSEDGCSWTQGWTIYDLE